MSGQPTTGPWRISHSWDDETIIASEEDWIAECDGRNHKANARLIAAAPDLLEALRPMVNGTYYITGKDVERARAAIAKAEGKS